MFYRPQQYVQILHILILALTLNCQKCFSDILLRNSAVLFRISKFFATIPLVINYHRYKGMKILRNLLQNYIQEWILRRFLIPNQKFPFEVNRK